MLNELLEKCFSEDKAASGTESGAVTQRIKTNVLLRIEREKPMKHYGIKAVVIAAAMMVGGLMTVLFTANASTNGNEGSISSDKDNVSVSQENIDFYGEEYATKLAIQGKNDVEIFKAYFESKTTEAKANGGIIIEKELDETDVVGYVPPCNMRNSLGIHDTNLTDAELEFVRRIEEEPESLGLIPVGKSEIFTGGYRIVNRHFLNTNEPEDGKKIYYSFRRVYTDDSENRLVASLYVGYRMCFDPPISHSTNDYAKCVLSVFLDHTEEGCVYGLSNSNIKNNSRGTSGCQTYYKYREGNSDLMEYCWQYEYFCLKPIKYVEPEFGHEVVDTDVVFLGNTIAVTDDFIQWMD